MLVVDLDNYELVGDLGKELVAEFDKGQVVVLGKQLHMVVELGKKLVVVQDKEVVVDMHMQDE